MSKEIKVKATTIQDAFGVSKHHIDGIADRLSGICMRSQSAKAPAGFVAEQVTETFTQEELQIIATMFIVRVINEQNGDEECNCDECVASRGENPNEDDVASALRKSIEERFPGMKAVVLKMPKDKDKTNC